MTNELTSNFCGNAVTDIGLCNGVLHNIVRSTGQNMLPSAPPSQSFIAGKDEISEKKFNTADTISAVTIIPVEYI